METETRSICHQCGFSSGVGTLCSNFGASKTPLTPAMQFKEEISIHPEADLRPIMEFLTHGGFDRVRHKSPSTEDFEYMCQRRLTTAQRQCLYRRWKLHLPGAHTLEEWSAVAEAWGGSASETEAVTECAERWISWLLYYV